MRRQAAGSPAPSTSQTSCSSVSFALHAAASCGDCAAVPSSATHARPSMLCQRCPQLHLLGLTPFEGETDDYARRDIVE
eukprot:1328359-Pleurochrysis_carterae.AAC.1